MQFRLQNVFDTITTCISRVTSALGVQIIIFIVIEGSIKTLTCPRFVTHFVNSISFLSYS